MKYLGAITDNKDLVNKEYVDNAIKGLGSGGSLSAEGLLALLQSGNNVSIEISGGKVKISALDYTPSYCKITLDADVTNYSTKNTAFHPFSGTIKDVLSGGGLSYTTKTLDYGDRTNQTVKGILVGSGVNVIRLSAMVRYLNNSSSTSALHTYIVRVRNGASIIFGTAVNTIGAVRMSQVVDTITSVQEGDFFFVYSYKGAASRDIDVIADYYATCFTANAIG